MNSHRTDPFSFITGILFMVIGLIALLGDVALDDVGGDWLGPVLLAAAGLALLASVPMRRSRPDALAADVGSDHDVAMADDEEASGDAPAEREGR
jgi:hypothetical protein